MRRSLGTLAVLATLAIAVEARSQPASPTHGQEGLVRPALAPWPCALQIAGELRELAVLAWHRSGTFREQCRTLAAARALLIVKASETGTAGALIGRNRDGVVEAHISICHRVKAVKAVELLAHELEHVVERVEGRNLLLGVGRSGAGVVLNRGVFETTRAIDAGRRVAAEVGDPTRARGKR